MELYQRCRQRGEKLVVLRKKSTSLEGWDLQRRPGDDHGWVINKVRSRRESVYNSLSWESTLFQTATSCCPF